MSTKTQTSALTSASQCFSMPPCRSGLSMEKFNAVYAVHGACDAQMPPDYVDDVVAHATTSTADGYTRVLLLAKQLHAVADTRTVKVCVTGKIAAAARVLSIATSTTGARGDASAKHGLNFAGQTFDGTTDGRPRGARVESPVTGHQTPDGTHTCYDVTLPSLSAAMLIVATN
eukprot:m.1063047 g.1063047  ORF g.1063047 m.1063047 type:complete len:173 (-) comp24215_c0_seq62:1166-1684(-)